jgi:hypothetical protein
LRIGTFGGKTDNEFIETHCLTELPAFFADLRGSSCGVAMNDEIWFLCHLVSYEERRHYYHCFVVFEGGSLKLKKWSALMTFDGEPVEYTLGMVKKKHMSNVMQVGYSCMDKTTCMIDVDMDRIMWNIM